MFGIQADCDLDGRGDDRCGLDATPGTQSYCDPDSDDDDDDATPDDLIQVASELSCNFSQFGVMNPGHVKAVVGSLQLAAVTIVDDGTADGGVPDGVPDRGELTKVQLDLRNLSVDRQTSAARALTNLTVGIRSTNRAAGCVPRAQAFLGNLAAGGSTATPPTTSPDALSFVVDAADPGPGRSTPFDLAEARFIVTAQADDMEGIAPDLTFEAFVDIDEGPLPPQIAASCPRFPAMNAAGVLCEDFDTERNGTPGFQFARLAVGASPADPLRALGDLADDVLGYAQGTGPGPTGTDGRLCSSDVRFGVPTCSKPVAEENDWHLHAGNGTVTLEGPGAGYDPPDRPGIGAPDKGKAHSGFRSMHWGRHTDAASTVSDTYRWRQVSAFVLDPPVNLGPTSQLDFWHMIQVTDDDSLPFIDPGTTFGGGQVQISLQGVDGRFGRWQRLSPIFNGYNSTIQQQTTICEFDPGDDTMWSTDETMCGGSPVWSDIGDIIGTDATCTTDTDGNDAEDLDCGEITCTPGPGCAENGSVGNGVWARSAFDLSPFSGRAARLRWIGMAGGGWTFGVSRSFVEPAGLIDYQYFEKDDGWWIDDIRLTDLRTGPAPIFPDPTVGGSVCTLGNDPVNCDTVTINVAGSTAVSLPGDASARLRTSDAPGQPVSLDARGTAARCDNGVLRFEWGQVDGTSATALTDPYIDLIESASPNGLIRVAPLADAVYRVVATCSSDTACTSSRLVAVRVYPGDGSDLGGPAGSAVGIDLTHAAGTTTISWPGGPQPPGIVGYDVFRLDKGTTTGVDVFPGMQFAGACRFDGVANPGAPGTASVNDPDTPAAGRTFFYQVGHSPVSAAPTARAALGPGNTGVGTNTASGTCGPVVTPSPMLP